MSRRREARRKVQRDELARLVEQGGNRPCIVRVAGEPCPYPATYLVTIGYEYRTVAGVMCPDHVNKARRDSRNDIRQVETLKAHVREDPAADIYEVQGRQEA